MDVIAVDDPTDGQLRRWHAVVTAVYSADASDHPPFDPAFDPPPDLEQTTAALLGSEPGSALRLWAAVPDAAGPDGPLAGVASLRLPGGPGADRPGEIDIRVRPELRGRGIGGALLAAAAAGLRADGRSTVLAQVLAGTPAVPFLEARGFRCVLTLRGLLLTMSEVDPGKLAALVAAGPPGYRLLQWTGAVPDGFAGALAHAKRAMADLPEQRRWDADRVREMAELVAKRGDDLYTVAAVRGAEVAGFTEVVVPAEAPERAAQYDTAVVPEHRGRRLGIWVKAAMLRWLRERRPEVREIETDNAGDNVHMLAVNEELGFRRLRESREYQAEAADLP